MIILKTQEEIELIREACEITSSCYELVEQAIKPGISTFEIDQLVHEHIISQGATPGFLNYGEPPFPSSACISINEEVVHGIPKKDRFLKEGDIVSVDLGAEYKGYHGDSARTYLVGEVRSTWQKLVRVAEEAFWQGMRQVKKGNRLGDIGHAVQTYTEKHGFGVIRELTGHGIGADLHEDPNLLNYGKKGRGVRLEVGMVMCLEPMITEGDHSVILANDQWTILTRDKKAAAHYENTFAITENGVEILTLTVEERKKYANEITELKATKW
ncbi:MAG: type I methionyl aminopeptidase [Clostridiaceae bacterium]|nr:type I methionyl aminopeptidase [Clostridiaceae bacterium]